MKRHYTLFLICLIAISSKSQITITASDLASANDSVLISVNNTFTTNTYTQSGTNQTWDFSTLTSQSQRYEKFDAPSTFPSIYAFMFNSFITSYGKENRQLTSLPIPGITFSAAYDFFKKTNSQLKQIGSGYIINGTPLPFQYTSPDIVYTLPLTYNHTDSCDFQFGLQIPGVGYYGEKGHRVNSVEGSGTVITPYGTFSALKVKSVITSVDTLFISSFGFGSNIPRPTRIEYKWLTNGKKIPVIQLNGNLIGGNVSITEVDYIDNVQTTDVADLNKPSISYMAIWPNPTALQSKISFDLKQNEKVDISLYNIEGKKISDLYSQNYLPGLHSVSINASDLKLSSGIYFIKTLTSNTAFTIKWVVDSEIKQ
jgi:Secretion system C-terminal sorting domain